MIVLVTACPFHPTPAGGCRRTISGSCRHLRPSHQPPTTDPRRRRRRRRCRRLGWNGEEEGGCFRWVGPSGEEKEIDALLSPLFRWQRPTVSRLREKKIGTVQYREEAAGCYFFTNSFRKRGFFSQVGIPSDGEGWEWVYSVLF